MTQLSVHLNLCYNNPFFPEQMNQESTSHSGIFSSL